LTAKTTVAKELKTAKKDGKREGGRKGESTKHELTDKTEQLDFFIVAVIIGQNMFGCVIEYAFMDQIIMYRSTPIN